MAQQPPTIARPALEQLIDVAKRIVCRTNPAESRRWSALPMVAWPAWAQGDVEVIVDILRVAQLVPDNKPDTKESPCPTTTKSPSK